MANEVICQVPDQPTQNLLPEGLLPAGWQRIRLGDHVTRIGSGLTPLGGESSYLSAGIPLIRSQNVLMNQFSPIGLSFISPEQDQVMCSSRVEKRDVLLNITGASIGRVCVVPDAYCPANVNQHVCVIRCTENLNPRYLALYLSTPGFQRRLMQSQAGATRQALTKRMIADFIVPLPPSGEQERIAALVEGQLGVIKRARAATQAQMDSVQALPAMYYRAAFGEEHAELSSGWRLVRLQDASRFLPARSIAAEGDTEIEAATSACLTETGFDPSGTKKARMFCADAVICRCESGEVLVARSNTPELVGRASEYLGVPMNIVSSDLTIRIRANPELNSSYLAAYLSALFLRGYWRRNSGGASGSMKKITRRQVAELLIPLPTIIEQKRQVSELNDYLRGYTRLRCRIETQLSELDALPAALLRRAFSGEL